MSLFQVPTPADDEGAIASAGASLRAVSQQLDSHHAQLVAAGALATEQWVGAASAQFIATHNAGLEQLRRVSAAHLAHAGAHDQYSTQVAGTKDAAISAHGALSGHLDDYSAQVRQQLDALHAEASHKFNEAKQHLENAGNDLLSGNLFGAVSQGFDAATSAFQGIADSAVEELLSQLVSWQPQYPAPQLAVTRTGVDQVIDLTSTAVLGELTAMGDFLASMALEAFKDVLAAMGLTAAANAVNATEDEFIANAVAAHRQATQAMHQLEQKAVHLAEQIGHEVEKDLTAVWHATEQLVNSADDWIAHHWVAIAKDFSTVMGDVAMVAGILALIPGVDVIAGPIAVIATGLKVADDVVLVATHHKDASALWGDAIDVVSIGAGGVIAKGAEGLVTSAKAADKLAAATVKAERLDMSAIRAERAAGHAIGTPLEASTRASADVARSLSDTAATKVAAIQKTVDGLPQDTAGALKYGTKALAKHPISTLVGDTKTALKLPSARTIQKAMTEQITGPGRFLYAANNGQSIGVTIHDMHDTITDNIAMFKPQPVSVAR